jgi:hypothetical protein
MPYTVTGLDDLSTVTLAPQGTPLWKTAWSNLAPRLGVAYVAIPGADHVMVLRGGAGVFFDTGQQIGSFGFDGPGFSAYNYFGTYGGPAASFPVASSVVNPPIVNPPLPPFGPFYVNHPHLELPYTFQWNISMEQACGKSQSLSLSYVGANGRKLLKQAEIETQQVNPNFGTGLYLFENGLTSSYNSLQAKFRRQLSRGLQALVSYTWAHALDFGSYNVALPYQHGSSDLDVRNNANAAVSYDLPDTSGSTFSRTLLNGWGIDGRFAARGGFPVTINGYGVTDTTTGQFFWGGVDLVPNEPLYLRGSIYPGGRSVNPAAFSLPPTNQSGDAPRNFVRGFGAVQTDVALRRKFRLFDSLNLQFRAEAFNVFNHPNFGTVDSVYGDVQFGQATASLAQSLGVLNPLYQMGGARSLQVTLKLAF